jgi:uncharacterized membrane protein YjfL (UPF0719 family)
MSDWRKWLFYVAALYDGLLGLLFVLFWSWAFDCFHITRPNHAGYVQFPGLLLIIFALMFLRIARDPDENRGLIDFGIALKVAYSGIVFRYALTTGIPSMWIWFACADVVFLVLFVIARASTRQRS